MINYIGIIAIFIAFFIPGVIGIIYFGRELMEEKARAKKAKESGNRAETK